MSSDETLDDGSLTAEQSLALIEAQRSRVQAETDVDPVLLYGVWGTAWLVGFGLWALTASRGDGDRVLDLPAGLVGASFAVLLVSAAAVTTWHSVRAGRGLRGEGQMRGAMYGGSWFLAFVGLFAVMAAVGRQGASDELMSLLSPLLACLLVGVMQMMGGAVWKDRALFAIGVWVLLCTAVGGLLGLPDFYLVMSLAGGGGFLLGAGWHLLRRKR